MMKRVLCGLTVLVMLLLAACGEGGGPESRPVGSEPISTTTTTTGVADLSTTTSGTTLPDASTQPFATGSTTASSGTVSTGGTQRPSSSSAMTPTKSTTKTTTKTTAVTRPTVAMGDTFIGSDATLRKLTTSTSVATLQVSRTANALNFDAFGVEWDPHYFRTFNVQSGCSEESWKTVTARLDKINVQKVRMMILPGWYEPQNDNSDPNSADAGKFTFGSSDMQSVLRHLDACERAGVRVNLTLWGVNLGVLPTMDWLAYADCGDWISAPTNKEELAENISVLLDFLLNDRGYTCIDELTLYNEPDWAYKGAGGAVSFPDYVELCRLVDARLKKDGLRDKLKLVLSDDTDTQGASSVNTNGWFANCLTNLKGIADGFSTHVYAFNDDASSYDSMYAWAAARNRLLAEKAPGHPYTHNEFGSNLQEGAYYQRDIDTYGRGVFVSQMAEATLNGGSAGMLYWVFHDVRYNNYPDVGTQSRMKLGLFAFADENWRVRPVYHAWGLIMKYTVPGSGVYATTGEGNVSGASLKSPEGKWTCLVTNDEAAPRVVKLNNPGFSKPQLNVHYYVEGKVPAGDDLVASSGVAYADGKDVYVYLPAHSFAVLTELKV